MNQITYHKATTNDTSVLVENRILFALEISGVQDKEVIQALRKQMTNYLLKAITDNTFISFIATSDGVVAGIGSMHIREMPGNFKNLSGKWAYIMNMYTIPAFRRKGICKSILNLLVEEGKQHGITGFDLHATAEGELVYRQNGFEMNHEPSYRKFIT